MLSYEEFCVAVRATGAVSNAADAIEASIKSQASPELWQLLLQLEDARMAEFAQQLATAYDLYQQNK